MNTVTTYNEQCTCWYHNVLCYAMLCCVVMCCVVMCCADICCAVLSCVVLCCVVMCCAVLCCHVLCCVDIRSEGGDGETSVMARVLSTFLNELDGISSLSTPGSSSGGTAMESEFNVFVLAASENLTNLDQALLRPGRLSYHVKLGFPTKTDIGELLRYFSKKLPLSEDVCMDEIVRLCTDRLRGQGQGPTCAAVSALCREAVQIALRERIQVTPAASSSSRSAIDLSRYSINEECDGRVSRSHFLSALDSFVPADVEENNAEEDTEQQSSLSKLAPFEFQFDNGSNLPIATTTANGLSEFKFHGQFNHGVATSTQED
jgi:hypothetical protein